MKQGRGLPLSAVWLAVLTGIIIAVFWPSSSFPFVVFDDPSFIQYNEAVTSPGQVGWRELLLTPLEGYIIPVTTAFQAAVWAIGDGSARAFHVAGIGLHIIVASMIFMMGVRLSKSHLAAGFAAALFAVHPLVVEPVVWATGNKDLVMTMLALAATALFFDAVEASGRTAEAGRTKLAFVLLLALLSCLAKPASVLIGLSWLAYLLAKRLSGDTVPWRATAVGLGAVVIGVLVGVLSRTSMYENVVDNPQAILSDLRFVTVLGHQAQHAVWPSSLHPIYDIDTSAGFSDWHTALGSMVLVGVAALFLALRRSPRAMLGLGFAVACYLPVSGIIPFPRIMADSYMYAPLAGVALLVACGVAQLMGSGSRRSMTVFAVLLVLAAIPLSIRSSRQVERWQGGRALWEPVVAAYPGLALAHDTLATSLLMGNEPAAAAEHYGVGFELEYRAEFLTDFAVALAESRQLDGAECVLIEAIYFGEERDRALQNYAILIGDYWDRPPRYAEQAAHLIVVIAQGVLDGEITATERMGYGLMVQYERVGEPAGEAEWPQGNCELTRLVY